MYIEIDVNIIISYVHVLYVKLFWWCTYMIFVIYFTIEFTVSVYHAFLPNSTLTKSFCVVYCDVKFFSCVIFCKNHFAIIKQDNAENTHLS